MFLIQCYACSVWYYGISQNLKNRLQAIQNKIIKFVLKLHQRSYINIEHFQQLGLLPVSSRVDHITLYQVFKKHNDSALFYINDHFIPASSVHNIRLC
jgi:hypothetical protein